MKFLLKWSVLASLLAMASAANAAMVFNVQFDNTPNGSVTAPIVGTGIISFDDNLGAGIYQMNTLSNLNMTFNFGSSAYNLGVLVSPYANLQAQISLVGLNYSLKFGGADFTDVFGNYFVVPA